MAPSLENYTYLIVDDVLQTRRVVKRILCIVGVSVEQVVEKGSGAEAIEWLREEKPTPGTIIISDFHLGEIKGLDVLEYARSHPAYRSAPFLMITNDIHMEDLVRAKEMGVSSYLLKPLSLENIVEHVYEAIAVEEKRSNRNF
jgi:CheY-like chemotaxis protein